MSKKLNPADPGKSLSMGFGFVQFYTQEEAKRAIKELQVSVVHETECYNKKQSFLFLVFVALIFAISARMYQLNWYAFV